MITRKRILIALKECKLLSSKSLRSVARATWRSGFLDSLSRLVAKGLVAKRSETVLGGRSTYYQLAQDLPARTESARLIDCRVDDLIVPSWRGRDLAHLEHCLLLASNLRQLFPEARVLCDFEILTDTGARDLLLTAYGDTDLIPDVLVIFGGESAVHLSIAFEVECSRKSDRRVIQKLSRYAAQTRLDGLVYLCASDRLAETVRGLYRNRSLERAIRIKHYSDWFLLLGSVTSPQIGCFPKLISSNLEETNLTVWMQRLEALKNKKPGLSSMFFENNKTAKNLENEDSPATCYPFTPALTTPHLHYK